MKFEGLNSLNTKKTLEINNKKYHYYSLKEAENKMGYQFSKLPFSLKILLENLLRFEDNSSVKVEDIHAFADWLAHKRLDKEIAFRPARVLMQDFTGVPAVVDLAAMRDAMQALGDDPNKINPLTAVDLVIDHSVQVDYYGSDKSFKQNVELEMQRNMERYEFLRWGQEAFDNFRVVPPGTGICHQVNLEHLAQVAWIREVAGQTLVYPDSLVGTDSHTTMINGLAVLGWGVGGIEAEAAMLGQPLSMIIPEVIGFKLIGKLPEGATATDLVLTVTQRLRAKGVVNKFVEFFGNGLSSLSLADRATIANMAPEYGATCGFFPVDQETINYLTLTGRDEDRIALAKAYAIEQGLWRDNDTPDPEFTEILELNLAEIEPSLAGPRRPQDRVSLSHLTHEFTNKELQTFLQPNNDKNKQIEIEGANYSLEHGSVVIAAITSCTNTSNPSVMIAAGLVARNALAKGIKVKPWVKTSLAPGSKVVTEYLDVTGLQECLDDIGFNLVGYGCTTCIGNSGPLKPEIEEAIVKEDLVVASILSGNRNFEGRIHPLSKANYLASPPLVVAYALAGSINIDITKDPIAVNEHDEQIYLKDIWPSNEEINSYIARSVTSNMFKAKYKDVFTGDEMWQSIAVTKSLTYNWSDKSTYINNPPYFVDITKDTNKLVDIKGSNLIAMFGDSITTDHISPAGNIARNSPAAKYLQERGIEPANFNSYGSRRGNHEVMMRGTFANIRIKNELLPGTEGGVTKFLPTGETMSIYDAAIRYQQDNIPLIVIAGKEYGTGSSRDWAAKGTLLLGIKAVIAESFERIHRSNLVGMGVIPLIFKPGMSRKDLNLKGNEKFDIIGLANITNDNKDASLIVHYDDGSNKEFPLICRIDTADEINYVMQGGILQFVLKNLAKSK